MLCACAKVGLCTCIVMEDSTVTPHFSKYSSQNKQYITCTVGLEYKIPAVPATTILFHPAHIFGISKQNFTFYRNHRIETMETRREIGGKGRVTNLIDPSELRRNTTCAFASPLEKSHNFQDKTKRM